jgi:hypothetical protein
MDGGRSSISAMGTARVSAVRFRSTRLKTLSASPAGGPPVAVGPSTAAGTASGRGRRLVLEKSVGCTGPTSVHNRYIVVNTLIHIKNDIYKRN